MSTTDQLVRFSPELLEQVRNAGDPCYEGRHRTTDHVATRFIDSDRVRKALRPTSPPRALPLLSRLLRAVRR